MCTLKMNQYIFWIFYICFFFCFFCHNHTHTYIIQDNVFIYNSSTVGKCPSNLQVILLYISFFPYYLSSIHIFFWWCNIIWIRASTMNVIHMKCAINVSNQKPSILFLSYNNFVDNITSGCIVQGSITNKIV